MGSIRLSEKQRLKYCYSGVYAIIEKYQNKYPDAIVQERSGWKVTGRRRRNQNPLYDVWPLHLTLCSTRQGMMLWIIKELYEKLTVTTCYLHPISGLLKTRREYKFSTQGDCCTFLKDTLWLNPENTDVTLYRFIINGMLDLANQRNVCEVEGGKIITSPACLARFENGSCTEAARIVASLSLQPGRGEDEYAILAQVTTDKTQFHPGTAKTFFPGCQEEPEKELLLLMENVYDNLKTQALRKISGK